MEDMSTSNNYQNIYRIVDDGVEDTDFSTELMKIQSLIRLALNHQIRNMQIRLILQRSISTRTSCTINNKIENKKSEIKGVSELLTMEDLLLVSNTYQHAYRIVDNSMEDIDFLTKFDEDTMSRQEAKPILT